MTERRPNLINKAFNQYLWASILTVAATQIANIVDAIIVGHMVGADGLAAVNLSKPLLQAFFATTCLYVASSTILTGMAIGRGDRSTANKLFSFSMGLSLLLGLLFSTAGMLFFDRISAFLCQSETLRPLSDRFMRVTLLSAAPQLLMLTLQQFVTVDGEPKLVSRAVIVGNICNVFLDVIFIKYCSWGIAGAASATCVMYLVCIAMVMPHFRRKGSLRLCRTKLGEVETGRIFSIGLPLFFSTVLMSVQYIGNNYVANRFLGDDGLIALAVCIQLLAFSMIILTGTLRTIQPVGSILKGLDDNRGMLMLMKRGYTFMGLCFVVFAALLVLFPAQIGTLLGVHEGSGLEMVRKAVPLFSLNIVFQGLLCNLLPAFQFYERKGLALLLSIAQTLLPMIFFFLLRGNWIGFFVGQATTALAILVWEVILRHRDRNLSHFLLIPMKDDARLLDMTLDASTRSLSEAITSLRSFLSSNGINSHTVYVAAVCTEEFVKNIICHGHASSIDLAASVNSNTVSISIHDDGMAFNPVETVQANDSRIGLGLTIASEFCEDINYKYIFCQNMLTLKIQNL
ncbi:MAG: polysaccharide biosynthesis C-terminal domain-containing protein [Bacteroidaceae bacterium]|nr:polysaccharide biosynthesis C-terminal domain-containing protein [Bacteroidaceae bacterium]